MTRTLFVGRAGSRAAWYRMVLPAAFRGDDWVLVNGEGAGMAMVTGRLADGFTAASPFFYDAVVLQSARGATWLEYAERLRDAGVRVLFDVDDDPSALRTLRDHDLAKAWTPRAVRELEAVMAACDGVLVSTKHLAERFAPVNPRTWVCRNGIDLNRYALTRPAHEGVIVGWAGGTGHRDALAPWLRELDAIMAERPDVSFLALGQEVAGRLARRHGADRARSLPFTAIETYPAAMTAFDVALAPAGDSAFYRAKSDLRWLEASALGIPVIADPVVYAEIEDGVTGLHAATAGEARAAMLALIADADLRVRIGEAAREHVREHRSMAVACRAWDVPLGALTGSAA
jgi:glycosyltransferase involved in cell wall biosynthesis